MLLAKENDIAFGFDVCMKRDFVETRAAFGIELLFLLGLR